MARNRYGEAIRFREGLKVSFPHFELHCLGRVHHQAKGMNWANSVYRFAAHDGAEVVPVEWSIGPGVIASTHFAVGGRPFSLELGFSERLGRLAEDELVIWPRFAIAAASGDIADAADYGQAVPLAPGGSLHFLDFSVRRDAAGTSLHVTPSDRRTIVPCSPVHVHRVIVKSHHYALAASPDEVCAWPLPTRGIDGIARENAEFGFAYVGPILGNPHGMPPQSFFDLPYPGFTLRFCGGPYGVGPHAIYSIAIAPGRIDRGSAPLLGLCGPSTDHVSVLLPAAAFERGDPQRFAVSGQAYLLQLIRQDDAGPLPTGALAVWPDD